ncbi:hypothetical protein [Kineosporia succinea]|uniref:Uncharacterized protein n=1 Tax=Kineosporia succinea TaxID=84632 RepID=A0ABT9PF02_9ACTN|nr:hypothetical protein [Kineosporia succinea]MDP9831282.1 hypothetical protein [Kineosporia succinea]
MSESTGLSSAALAGLADAELAPTGADAASGEGGDAGFSPLPELAPAHATIVKRPASRSIVPSTTPPRVPMPSAPAVALMAVLVMPLTVPLPK